MNTEKWDGEELWVRKQVGILRTYTHTNKHTQINTQNTRIDYVGMCTCSHARTNGLARCDPDTQRGYGSTHQPFIACCSHCWQTHTHSHRSGHRLQPNTKPQAVIEADWPAPLYFQSIYSVHPGLYILIMCSASFPKRRGDRVCYSGTGAAAGHWNEALPVFMGSSAQQLHHYMTFKLWTKTQWMPHFPCLSWHTALVHWTTEMWQFFFQFTLHAFKTN